MRRFIASVVMAALMASGCVRATRTINTAPLTPAELAAHAYGYSAGLELINVSGEFRRIEIPGGRYQYVTQPLVTAVTAPLEAPAGPLLTRVTLTATVFDNGNPPGQQESASQTGPSARRPAEQRRRDTVAGHAFRRGKRHRRTCRPAHAGLGSWGPLHALSHGPQEALAVRGRDASGSRGSCLNCTRLYFATNSR